MKRWLLTLLAIGISCGLSGCEGFLYPLISNKDAIEDPRVEGLHEWKDNGEPCSVLVTKVHSNAYKAVVTFPEGKTELLLQLMKIRDQIFFQLSSYPPEPINHPDEQAAEGMYWAFLNTLTSRPTYLIGKIVSFEPHLRITFFNSREAAHKYFPPELADSFKSYPIEYDHPQKFDGLVVLPPDKLRKFVEESADNPDAFADLGYAK